MFAVTECPGARSCARASVILTCPPLCMLQRCTCIQRTLVFHTVNSEGWVSPLSCRRALLRLSSSLRPTRSASVGLGRAYCVGLHSRVRPHHCKRLSMSPSVFRARNRVNYASVGRRTRRTITSSVIKS